VSQAVIEGDTKLNFGVTAVAATPGPKTHAHRDHAVDRIVFALLLAGLLWAPAWYGSDRPQAWAVNAILFPGLLVVRELAQSLGRAESVKVTPLMLVAFALVGIAFVWACLQLSVFTPKSWHHPLWPMTNDVLGTAISSRIAIAPDRALIALMRFVTVASAFWLAVGLGQNETRSRYLVFAVTLIVTLYSLLGFLTVDSGYVLSSEAPNPDSVTATFLNRNSFAQFAGMGFLAGIAITVRELRKMNTHPDMRENGLASLRRAPVVLLAVLSSLICCAAMLLSQSRGGTIATLIGFAVFIVLSLRTGNRRAWLSGIGILLVVLIIGGLADLVTKRIVEQGVIDASRAAIRDATAYAVQGSALYGYGLDSFPAIFPMFRDDAVGVWGVWEKAHNIYLDTLLDLGVIAGTCLLAGIALIVLACAIGSLRRRRNASVPTCAVAVSVLVGVHGTVDFALSIQANALIWAVLLGVGLAQSTSHRTA
jgi:O-antigen ligase